MSDESRRDPHEGIEERVATLAVAVFRGGAKGGGLELLRQLVGSTGTENFASALQREIEDVALDQVPALSKRVGALELELKRRERGRKLVFLQLLRAAQADAGRPEEPTLESVSADSAEEAVLDAYERVGRVRDPEMVVALARITHWYTARGRNVDRFFRNCGQMIGDLVPGEVDGIAALIGSLSSFRKENRDPPSQFFRLFFREQEGLYRWSTYAVRLEDRVESPVGVSPEAKSSVDALLRFDVGERVTGGMAFDRGAVMDLDVQTAERLAAVFLSSPES